VTHFGRAMYELNIDTFCANSSPAKGRVERAHLTLQDRLVKELRLLGISTLAKANAYAPAFTATYNAHFAKPPKSVFDAHPPLRADEDLERVFTWCEPRKVTKSLTVQYDRDLGVSGWAYRTSGRRTRAAVQAVRLAGRNRSGCDR